MPQIAQPPVEQSPVEHHVEQISDIHELAGYRLIWKALLSQTRAATFFQSLDWLEVYWRHSGHGQKLRVLIVHEEGKPIGILPLVVLTESTRVGPVRVLTYPLHDWGTFYGPIGPNPTVTLRAGMEYVARAERDWDLLDMRWVDAAGCDRRRTPLAMRAAGFSPQQQPWAQTAVVDMNGTWEEYWSSRTKKWRHNVNRCQRRLAERGEITYIRYRPEGDAYGDGDPRWDLYDACVELSRRSWQGSSETGTTLCHESVCEYLRDTHAAAAKTGSLDLNLLLGDGKPAAFVYNYHYHGRVYGLRMGFDPDLTAVGPGSVLQQMMLEDGFRRQDKCYDLGAGSLDCKRHWLTRLATCYRYTHFPATTIRAQVLRLKRLFVQWRGGPDYVVSSKQKAV